MSKICSILVLLSGLTFIAFTSKQDQPNQEKVREYSKSSSLDTLTIYQSENLIIQRLTDHVYVHVSFLNTDDFGKVACNGMFVVNDHQGIIFDTPTDNKGSLELINFVTGDLKIEITALIPTHFHEDCAGGIQEFEAAHIPVYACDRTIELLKKNGQKFSRPIAGFDKSITLKIGNKKVCAAYFGEGHTKDNIIGYFPEDHTIFGGCLIKEVGAGKGYLGDANTSTWPETVRKIKSKYPKVEIVIPGHGKWGGTQLFDYTIELFQ